LVDLANAVPGTMGARLTGAGWGGCIVALVRQESAGEFQRVVAKGYRDKTGLEAQIFACRSAAGAGEVWRTSV
jgi:galactokinase